MGNLSQQEREHPRATVEALTALVMSADAYRRWSASGSAAGEEAIETLEDMLRCCDRISANIRALLSQSRSGTDGEA